LRSSASETSLSESGISFREMPPGQAKEFKERSVEMFRFVFSPYRGRCDDRREGEEITRRGVVSRSLRRIQSEIDGLAFAETREDGNTWRRLANSDTQRHACTQSASKVRANNGGCALLNVQARYYAQVCSRNAKRVQKFTEPAATALFIQRGRDCDGLMISYLGYVRANAASTPRTAICICSGAPRQLLP